MIARINDAVCAEICAVFGLKHVREFHLYMSVDKGVFVEASFYPESDGMKSLIPIFKRYELVEKKI